MPSCSLFLQLYFCTFFATIRWYNNTDANIYPGWVGIQLYIFLSTKHSNKGINFITTVECKIFLFLRYWPMFLYVCREIEIVGFPCVGGLASHVTCSSIMWEFRHRILSLFAPVLWTFKTTEDLVGYYLFCFLFCFVFFMLFFFYSFVSCGYLGLDI